MIPETQRVSFSETLRLDDQGRKTMFTIFMHGKDNEMIAIENRR